MTRRGPIDWPAIADALELKHILEELLPPGTPLAELQALAQGEGLECSDLADGAVHCSAPARSGLAFTRAKWLMVFHFEKDALARIDVTRGLIGP